MRIHGFEVEFDEGESGWGASVPDLPGCVAVGATREVVLALISDAILLHVFGANEGAPRISLTNHPAGAAIGSATTGPTTRITARAAGEMRARTPQQELTTA